MFEPNLSIDVSLLGIILGLYATKNDKNLILLLICVLFAHVLMTNDDGDNNNLAYLLADNVVSEDDGSNDDISEDDGSNDDISVESRPGDASLGVGAATNAIDTNINENTDNFKTTVSSGVFDRQLSTPQTHLTSTVFPATSIEANGKLASARGSFFKSLVS